MQPGKVRALRDPGAAGAAVDGPLAGYFMFEEMSKDQYARQHAMHIADHMGDLPA